MRRRRTLHLAQRVATEREVDQFEMVPVRPVLDAFSRDLDEPQREIQRLARRFSAPTTTLYGIFGVNVVTTHLWPLLLSMVQLVLVMIVGRRLFGDATVVLAGLLLAISPLDALYGFVLSPDVVLAAFLTAAGSLSHVRGRSVPSPLSGRQRSSLPPAVTMRSKGRKPRS